MRISAVFGDICPLKGRPGEPFVPSVSKSSLEHLELIFGSEFPTERAPERAALAARKAAQVRTDAAEVALLSDVTELHELHETDQTETWCDSEAPTSVAAERPLLPRPPRSPKL